MKQNKIKWFQRWNRAGVGREAIFELKKNRASATGAARKIVSGIESSIIAAFTGLSSKVVGAVLDQRDVYNYGHWHFFLFELNKKKHEQHKKIKKRLASTCSFAMSDGSNQLEFLSGFAVTLLFI